MPVALKLSALVDAFWSMHNEKSNRNGKSSQILRDPATLASLS